MKLFFTSLTTMCLMLGSLAYGQEFGKISGKLIDGKDQPVSFANVALLSIQDSSLLTGSVSDVDGKFVISAKPGKYFLRVTAVGYETQTKGPFQIIAGGETAIPGILVKEDVKMLGDVQVTAIRPAVRLEADKLVVDIENSASAKGSTALEALEKSPGVYVDQDGNINLNGQQGVRVMIDGKPSFLAPKELASLLNSMPAENIKDIEIISNASSKYDAEGTSGIININLKKNTIKGTNGSINAGTEYNRYMGYFGGVTLNHKSGKWNVYSNLDIAQRQRYGEIDVVRNFNFDNTNTELTNDFYMHRTIDAFNGRVAVDYQLNDKNSLGISTSMVQNTEDGFLNSNLMMNFNNQMPNQFIQSRNGMYNGFNQKSLNLNYTGKLDSLGTLLTADIDVFDMRGKMNSSFENDYFSEGSLFADELIESRNPNQYLIVSGKLDYVKPMANKRKLELGMKSSYVKMDNDMSFTIWENESWQLDPSRSNHFIYTENIIAGYSNFSTPITPKISLMAGLRAEQTFSEGYSVSLDQKTPRNYFNLFPSVFVQQRINDGYSINYSVSRRINRPNYRALNPLMFYLDPYTIEQGNPFITPAYSNSYEINQIFKGKYQIAVNHVSSENSITSLPLNDAETRVTTLFTTNFDKAYFTNVRFIVPLAPFKWWNMNNTIMASRQQFVGNFDGDITDISRFGGSFQSFHTFILPQKTRFEVNGFFQMPGVYGVMQIQPFYWIDMAVKKSVMKDKLELSINASDVFRTRLMRVKSDFQDTQINISQYNGFQAIRFTARYKFSRGEKVNGVRNRGGIAEEQNRI